MSAGPIPWNFIHMYAMVNGFDTREEYDDLQYIVRYMDNVYLKFIEEKNNA